MRRSTPGVATASALALVAVVVACSADGGADSALAPPPPPPATDSDGIMPGAGSGVGAADSQPKDGGNTPPKDASADAGPPPPDPGTPCSKIDEIREKSCGICGKASTICTTSDGGAPAWSDYSSCNNELPGGCVPGTTATEGCGYCGTRPKTCTKVCTWSLGQCGGQPANACAPSSQELTGAGCAAGTFRKKTCDIACAWGAFSDCAPPPATVEVPTVLGSVNFSFVVLTAAQKTKRLVDFCPTATLNATATPYAYVAVHNGNAKPAFVSIYNSQAPSGPVFETLLATYGSTKPTSDSARKACKHGVADLSDDFLTGDERFAALDEFEELTIGAGKTIYVYNAAFASTSTGVVQFNVMLDGFD